MRASIAATEVGLALVLMARSFTRIYYRRAIARFGLAGARAAAVPGTGVIPVWVSLVMLNGYALAMFGTVVLLTG